MVQTTRPVAPADIGYSKMRVRMIETATKTRPAGAGAAPASETKKWSRPWHHVSPAFEKIAGVRRLHVSRKIGQQRMERFEPRRAPLVTSPAFVACALHR